MDSFKVGDVVQLKSRGPEMTVVAVDDPGDESSVSPEQRLHKNDVSCTWFDDDQNLETGKFPSNALRLLRGGS